MKLSEDLKAVQGDMIYKVGRDMYGDHYILEYVVTDINDKMIRLKSNTGKYGFTERQVLSQMNIFRRSGMTPWILCTKEELEKQTGETV